MEEYIGKAVALNMNRGALPTTVEDRGEEVDVLKVQSDSTRQ